MEEAINPTEKQGLSYKDAGVDIDAGAALVEAIKPHAKSTNRPGVISGLGGFGAMFDLKAAGFTDPILVAGTDGVGTKLKVAIEAKRHDTVGIDLVAMCVNDLVVQGAEPLLFLDYYAMGRLEVETGRDIIAGIAEGCRQGGCALIGGETAEMPGMYGEGDYDLAGFAVGAVERSALLTGADAATGDILIGVASSGPHSNGYSLIRKVVERAELGYDAPCPFEGGAGPTLGEALLVPTRIYVKSCLAAIREGGVNGLIHITGGGFQENIPRVLPAHTAAEIDCAAWTVPPVFKWIAQTGGVAPAEMMRTFNCGIGMVLAVDATKAVAVEKTLKAHGETVAVIGRVAERAADKPAVILNGLEGAWNP